MNIGGAFASSFVIKGEYETMKLKKKQFKLVSNLYVKGKSVGLDIKGAVKGLFQETVTSVDVKDIESFREGLSESDRKEFDQHSEPMQKAIVGRVKEQYERSMKFIEFADMFIEKYPDLETEIDSIIMGATGMTQSELDEMDIDKLFDLFKDMFEINKAVFTSPHQQK